MLWHLLRGLLLCLLLSSCAMKSKESPPVPFISWAGHDLVGTTLSLESPSGLPTYRFENGGWVFATIGDSKVQAAPSYRWQLDTEGVLRISNDGRSKASLHLISMTDGKVTVWNETNGATETYRRKKR